MGFGHGTYCNVLWKINKPELEALLKAAEKLTPSSSRRKKRRPYMINFMLAIQNNMDLSAPLGASVFTCLATCFFTTGHIGEFTIQRLDSFNPELHVSRTQLSYNQNQDGQQVTVLHLPCTKVSLQGEYICWAKQDGPMDPDTCWPTILRSTTPLRMAISSLTATRTDTDPS